MDKLAFQVDGKFIDAATNKTISNPSGYEVIEWPEEFDFPSSGELENYDVGLIDYYKLIKREQDSKSYDPYANTGTPRTAVNNFGYENKPGFIEAANFIPGPMGLAGKAINVAMNVNNKVAIDKAREMLDLEPSGKMSNVLRDTKGSIADVNIGGEDYSVGFEAVDNKGRTTLTPEEARERGLMTGGLSELTKEQRKEALKDFKKDKKAELSPIDSWKVAPDVGAGIGTGAGASGKFDLSENVFGAKADMPDVDRSELQARGMGLMDVSPSFRQARTQGINYDHTATRGPVTEGLTDRSVEAMNALAGMQPGGINVTSAYRNPEINKAVGGVPNSLHTQGSAFDLSTRGLTDAQKRDLVERSIMAGAEEIGTYGDQSLHVGTRGRFDALPGQDTGGVAAMYEYSRYNLADAPDWFKEGVSSQSRLAPIPQSRPMPSTMISEAPTNPQKDPFEAVLGRSTPTIASDTTGFVNSFSEVARAPTVASDSTGFMNQAVNPDWSGVDRSSLNITDDDRRLSAMTLAGEIDLSKTDLSTPEGIREAYGIMSTIENRAPKFGGISNAITAPKQYSTWSNAAASNTATKNYMTNPSVYDKLVNDYFANPKSNMGFTSYHANYVNPDWSTKMSGVTDIGPHRFGSLPEYQQPRSSFIPDNPPVPQERPTFKTTSTNALSSSSGFMDTGGANRPASKPDGQEIESRAERERKSATEKSKDNNGGNRGGGSGEGGTRTASSQTGSGRSFSSTGDVANRDKK